MTATVTMPVRVLDTVDAISAPDWCRLTQGCGLYSSRPWLRSLEDDPTHDVWYVTAYGDTGAAIGVLPVYLPSGLSQSGADSFYDPGGIFFSGDPAAADRWRPALLAVGRAGYDGELLIDPALAPAQRNAVLAALTQRYAKIAQAWGVDGRAAMYLTAPAAGELAPHLHAQPLLTDLTTVLDLDGVHGVDDYLARLSTHRRGRVRRELRDFAASGLGLRWSTLGESAAAIAPLLAIHHQRYGHADTAAMLTMHLTMQAEALDDLSHVLLCEQAGQLLGALVAYEWDGVWYARVAAAGAGLRGQAFAFFSMVFYAPLLAAIEHGARSYVLGPSGLQTKTKRGAGVRTRWSLLAGDGALGADVERLSARWPAHAAARWLSEEGIDTSLLDRPGAGRDT